MKYRNLADAVIVAALLMSHVPGLAEEMLDRPEVICLEAVQQQENSTEDAGEISAGRL